MHGRYYSVIRKDQPTPKLLLALDISHHHPPFNHQECRHYCPLERHWLWSNLEAPSSEETFFYRSEFHQFFGFTSFSSTLSLSPTSNFNLLKFTYWSHGCTSHQLACLWGLSLIFENIFTFIHMINSNQKQMYWNIFNPLARGHGRASAACPRWP